MEDLSTNQNSINNKIKSIGLLDTQKLESRFFRDADFLNEMLSNYIITSKNCIEEIEIAEKNKNPMMLANSTHKLLGSTLNFSSGYITRLLEDIELQAREHGKIIINDEDIIKLKEMIENLQQEIGKLATSWK